MIDPSKTQHSSSRLSILLVMLGMCVFFWGLGYKLSLYESHEPSVHQIPEAKLLSSNEDPSANRVRLCLTNLSKPTGLVLVAVLVRFWRGLEAPDRDLTHPGLEMKQVAGTRLHPGLTAFFFRPPPARISL